MELETKQEIKQGKTLRQIEEIEKIQKGKSKEKKKGKGGEKKRNRKRKIKRGGGKKREKKRVRDLSLQLCSEVYFISSGFGIIQDFSTIRG